MDRTGERGRVDPEKLAWYLSVPSLVLGCYPASPWRGRRIDDSQVPASAPSPDLPSTLDGCFRAAVAACVDGHERVAALYLGDLSSAALVATASSLCRSSGRSLLVVVADGLDHGGVSLATRSLDSLAGLALGDLVSVVETGRWFRPMPAWSNPVAPDIRHTEFVARASVLAGDWGATVLLSPSGGDAVLAGPRFLTGRLGRDGRTARYLGDAWRATGPAGLLAEALARLGPLGRRPRVGSLRLSVSRLAAALGAPPAGLSRAARDAAREWTADWARRAASALATGNPAAGEAALLRQVAVAEAVVAGHGTRRAGDSDGDGAGVPPRRLPFLDPHLVERSATSPLADRYDGRLSEPYLRRRAVLVHLVPVELRVHLPRRAPVPHPDTAYRRDMEAVTFPRCAALGLLDTPDPGPGTGSSVLRRLAVVEDWLTGADCPR